MRIKTLIWVIFFSIAMGYLESAVVVYLRELYYPEGFDFPLKIMDPEIGATEFFREVATIIMLLGISLIASRKKGEVFAYFIIAFAVWDISYYIFLKVLLGWPESLLTWDILFLIPVTWVGPVIGPVMNSLTMILLGVLMLHFTAVRKNSRLKWHEWTLLILGALFIIHSYILDYSIYMLNYTGFWDLFLMKDPESIMTYAGKYIPATFNWYIFGTGQIILLIACGLYFQRMQKSN